MNRIIPKRWKRSLLDFKCVQVLLILLPFAALAYGTFSLFFGETIVVGKYAQRMTYTGWEGILAAVGYQTLGLAMITTFCGQAMRATKMGMTLIIAGLIFAILFAGIATVALFRTIAA